MTLILQAGVKTIADQISPCKQGWTRELTVEWTPGHAPKGTPARYKIRATVYRDSYDFQSRIKVEVWSQATLSWNTIRTLAGEDHRDLPSAYLLAHGKDQAEGKRRIFVETGELTEELIAYAQSVLLS